MKKTLTTILLLAGVMFTLVSNGFTQSWLNDPKYGADEEVRKECIVNLNLYGEHYKHKNYNLAKPYWQKTLQMCPASSQNLYIQGCRMIKTWIGETTSFERKNQLIDSLMMLYDMRIEHFNRRGILLGQKGMDLIQFDTDRYEEAYNILKESIDLEKGASDSPVLYTFMVISKTMFDNGKVTAENVIETYALLADYLDLQLSKNPEDGRLLEVKENVDAIFSTAGVANCESLEKIFEPRIDSNPNDLDLIKQIHTLLSANRCDSKFYTKVLTALLVNEPTSTRAYELARIYVGLKDFQKAENYYQQAIEIESDNVQKSKLLVDYAGIVFSEFKRSQQARSLALDAIAANPGMGHAYILIGNIYASEKNCFSDEFQKKTIYWVAVDKFNKAKQVDPSLAPDCDRLIEVYAQYFPAQNDIFFQDLTINQSYNVGCWINENTTVRARP